MAKRVHRRDFLGGLGAATFGLWAAGCGSSSTSNGLSGGAGPTGGSGTPALSTRVTGTLNTEQIGGSALRVLSILDGFTPVNAGAFSTSVSADRAQALLVLDGQDKLRAMTINLPGQSPGVDATSTALAILFLTPGIGSTRPELAPTRLSLIRSAPGFPAFVQVLQAAMLSQDLVMALQAPAVKAARDLVVEQVLAQLPGLGTGVQPRTTGEETQIQSDGYVLATKDDSSTESSLVFNLSNEGFRFVKIVREDHFNATQQTVTPVLRGSASGSSVMAGRGGFSLGSILSGITGGGWIPPGGAGDTLSQAQHQSDRIVYWVSGVGNPFHAGEAEDVPAHISAAFESLGYADVAMTFFFYFLLPVVEPILYAHGIAIEDLITEVGKFAERNFARAGIGLGGFSVTQAIGTDLRSFQPRRAGGPHPGHDRSGSALRRAGVASGSPRPPLPGVHRGPLWQRDAFYR